VQDQPDGVGHRPLMVPGVGAPSQGHASVV
jgi:hypothetical protein